MRKKRKIRGRAERAALAAAAAEAGVMIEDSAEAESDTGSDSDSDSDSDADSDSRSGPGPDPDADADAAAAAAAAADADAVAGFDPGSDADSDADADADADSDSEAETDAAEPSRPQAAAFDEDTFTSLIEALLFASDKPLTIARLRQLTRVSDTGRIQVALERLTREHTERGVVLSNISGGYSFRTHSRFSPWVQQLIQGRPVRLSRAQLETLALVAYRQPITRPEIDQIRGVDSAAPLKLLLDRSLIRILGKREEVGRPLLYGTTREFLDFFSLNDLRELPTLREFSELTEESRGVVERLGLDLPPVAPSESLESPHLPDDEIPAEVLAPEVPADVMVSDHGNEHLDHGLEHTRGDAILGSPDPDSFDESSDGTMS